MRLDESAFIAARWNGAPSCPSCGGEGNGQSGNTASGWRQWRCRGCRRKFTAATGTRISSTNLPPEAWLAAAALSEITPSSVSEALSLSRATAYRVASVLSETTGQTTEERVRYLVGNCDRRQKKASGDPWLKERMPPYLSVDDNPLPHLSSGAKAVVNALRNRVGGATAAKVAELSGVSYSHTCKILAGLEQRGITAGEKRPLGHGDGIYTKTVWRLSWTAECHKVIDFLRFRKTEQVRVDPDTVPSRFWWNFWSGTHGSQLRISEHGLHIAATLIGGRDVCAQMWALRNMPTAVLLQCREMRGLDSGEVSEMIAREVRRREVAA